MNRNDERFIENAAYLWLARLFKEALAKNVHMGDASGPTYRGEDVIEILDDTVRSLVERP